MLKRLVYLIGPGADEIGARAFGLIARTSWTGVFAGRIRLGASHDRKIMATIADSPQALAQGLHLLDHARGSQFDGYSVLAYSARASLPPPVWYASARFEITILHVPPLLDRFHTLETTASVLSALGQPSELIEDRLRQALP